MERDKDTLTEADTALVWWDALPSVDTPAGAPLHGPLGPGDIPEAEDPEPERPKRSVSRRRFMQGALAVGGALSLNGLQILSGVKLRPAAAAVGSEYLDCANYGAWGGYNNNTLVCVGGSYSYIYCGTDGWFKNGYFDNGYTFYTPIAACGHGLPKRNAWRWPHGAYRYRCADGNFWYYRSGWIGPQFKICSQWIGYS